MDLNAFWRDVLSQDRERLPAWFCEDAVIRWHCTNEQFSVPLAGHVWPEDRSASFHVVSFIRMENGRIRELDEYWADDGEAPSWRREMKIGRPIR